MKNNNKNRKMILVSIVFTLLFSIVLSGMGTSNFVTFASTGDIEDTSTTDTYGNGEYAITEYHIDMKVNENNTFDMTEHITAYFNVKKHGIYRTLPLRNKVIRLDGTSHTNRAIITDIEVNDRFTTYRENGDTVIKIGSDKHTLTGDKSYVIKYRYDIGKDPSKDCDELYYNLIGPEWDTTISNFSFTITMPKETDMSKLGFSLGSIGSTNSSAIDYAVDGNVITGRCNRVVEPGEALTVRLELPEGYFVGTSGGKTDILVLLMFVIPVLLAIVSILLWRRYGKDDQVVDTVEFYPPEGLNSLEVGFYYNGRARYEDVISLLVYLANKGYIQISEPWIDSFTITKLKEYDGSNTYEKMFLSGLFSGRPVSRTTGLTEVKMEELKQRFYITIMTILKRINSVDNIDEISEQSAHRKAFIILPMIIAVLCIISAPPVLMYGMPILSLLGVIICPLVGFGIMFNLLFSGNEIIHVDGASGSSPIINKIIGLIFGIIGTGIPIALVLVPIFLEDKMFLYVYIVGVICVMVMNICLNNIEKRTYYGNQMLGKLRGFKKFLETAEKQKLESLVMQDPHYFYNILPYAYVLGVSSKWINKFETIAIQSPDWYCGSTSFNVTSFGASFNSTMSKATTVVSSAPSSGTGGSSRGGSSGGGFSGGGSGGGGGGSW